MSVQFGKCNFDGKPIDPRDLEEARPVLAPYGPDGEGYICQDNLGIIYRALHTTMEASREIQPQVSRSGCRITWDGRLDNRKELIGKLNGLVSPDATDLEIVAALYDRSGTNTFRELIGDWALSIWNPKERVLLLAKDFAATRHLYYTVEGDAVTWCTLLDPLVLFAGHAFELDKEYIAGWLAFFPAAHLTPYIGIHSVPPSSFVSLSRGKQTVTKYWNFDASKRIRYGADGEYEEHFRFAFAESVRRRLRSSGPVVAELSGGMDSSSIVCMADRVRRQDQFRVPALQTLSYYDDSEPNWQEHLYFTAVERERHQTGMHINLAGREIFRPLFGNEQFCASPANTGSSDETSRSFSAFLNDLGSRVILSGIGGDEVAGGVPTPNSEFADLLTRAHFLLLARQLKQWALNRRRPWFHLLFEALRGLLPPGFPRATMHKRPAPWLQREFVTRNRGALLGYDARLRLLGPLPSFQENLNSLDSLRRQLASDAPSCNPALERRYPFLDRDLLEVLFAFPREQILRPGQRRSLLRRSMKNIVPETVLNRRRKAYVATSPLRAVASEWALLKDMSSNMTSAEMGIVDPSRFAETLEQARSGQAVALIGLLRTIGIEGWLRNVEARGLLKGVAVGENAAGDRRPTEQRRIAAAAQKFQSLAD